MEDSSQKTNLKTNLKNDQKILGLIRKNSRITAKELVQATGLSLAGVKYNLTKLKKENLLRRIGSDKGGHWEILEG